MSPLRFAAVGPDFGRIYDEVECFGGGELIIFHAAEEDVASEFAEQYPAAERALNRRHTIEDEVLERRAPFGRAKVALGAMVRTSCSTSRA